MCLGIPARIVELVATNDQLAMADVAGTARPVNLGMLDEGGVQPGDWVLLHMGFAMSVIDEREAALALEGLHLLSGGETSPGLDP